MTLAASLPALFSDEHGPALVAVLLTPPVLAAVLFAAAFLAQHGSRLAALWLMALGSVQPVVRLVALLLVLDATLHAGLVPAHAGHAGLLAVLFGLDALALLLVAIWTTVAEGWEPVPSGGRPLFFASPNDGGGQLVGSILPKSPCDSSSRPAVKNSAFVGPELALPEPNAIAQSPSMVKGRLSGPRSWSMNCPLTGSITLIRPSPKLPTSNSFEKRPKLVGAMATPHGEFSRPRVAARRMKVPLVSKTSTNPLAGPATSS